VRPSRSRPHLELAQPTPPLVRRRPLRASAPVRGKREEPAHRRSPARTRDGPGTFAALLDEARVGYQVVETFRGRLPDHAAFDGAIALGGSLSALDPPLLETRRWIRNGVLSGLPFLGICLGGQLLASALGAAVERQARPEVGVHDIYLTDAGRRDPLFSGLPGRLEVFGWHEASFDLPRGTVPLAGSIACTYQAFRFGLRPTDSSSIPRLAPSTSLAGAKSPATTASPSGPEQTSTR
jgi:GMP synthase (glutamine-hydrolysing)